MEERQLILDTIEKYNIFLIPSRKEIFGSVCDVSKLTSIAKQLNKEKLINWDVYFEKNCNAIVLTKYVEYNSDLTDIEKEKILNKINKTGYYILKSRKLSKLKNWGGQLKFLKELVVEEKADWYMDYKEKKYIFSLVDNKLINC